MRHPLERTDNPDDLCIVCGLYKKVEGTDYCGRHGANKALERKGKESLYKFTAEQLRTRINVLAADPKRYTLDEELGVLRLTLENKLNTIKAEEIAQHADTIGTLIDKIQKLVDSSIKISKEMRLLMTPQDLNGVIQAIVTIMDNNIQDKELLDTIAGEILSALDDAYAGRQTLGEMHQHTA